jgi:ribonuclease D
MPGPVYCTKIASKLVRTYTDRHGLKDLTRELLGIDMSKAQQSSDWAAPELSQRRSNMQPRTCSTFTL